MEDDSVSNSKQPIATKSTTSSLAYGLFQTNPMTNSTIYALNYNRNSSSIQKPKQPTSPTPITINKPTTRGTLSPSTPVLQQQQESTSGSSISIAQLLSHRPSPPPSHFRLNNYQ
jgi:hypothetical protein